MNWNLAGGVGVVTGAASGIGRSLAKLLGQEKMSLALGDVDERGLQETIREIHGAGRVSAHVVDVADYKSIERFSAEILERHQRVNLLINNAGVALPGPVETLSLEDMHWLMDVNFWGVVYGVKVFLPWLKREPRAHIVNISSFQGIVASARNSAYCSSKFAVRGFTEALQRELEGTTVGVTCVHPGTVRTNLSYSGRPSAAAPGGSKIEEADDYLQKNGRTSPETVADRVVRGVKRGERRILIGRDAVWADRLQRLLPSRYDSPLDTLRTLRKSIAK